MTTTIDAAKVRQEVRAWAKVLMAGRTLDADRFLFDQLLHAMHVDTRTGFFKCERDLGCLGRVQQRRMVKSFARLREAGVLRFVDAGALLLVYIPKKVVTDG